MEPPPVVATWPRLPVGYQRLDGLGRHGGSVGDVGGDASGVAEASVEGSMIQPRPDCHCPPFDTVRRLRPRMGRHGMGTGKKNEH